MVGLKDLARQANVSIRTVARVLRGERYVREEVRSRVLDAARSMGYRPDRHARSLKTGSSTEVVALAWSTDELHIAKMAGLEERLREDGYTLSIVFDLLADCPDSDQRVVNEMKHRRPAGVVIQKPIGGSCARLAKDLTRAGLRYVAIDTPERGVDAIGIDRPQGVYEAVMHVASRGRERIAYVGPRENSRIDGYRKALAELDRRALYLDVPAELAQFEAGRQSARHFAKHSSKADAVQAYTDLMALGFMAGLHDAGIRVPDDVAIVGFDDRRAASVSWPTLTTVAQPNHEVGRAAGEVLLGKLAGREPGPQGWSRMLPTKLVVREST